jgi:hypothetical protein
MADELKWRIYLQQRSDPIFFFNTFSPNLLFLLLTLNGRKIKSMLPIMKIHNGAQIQDENLNYFFFKVF